MWTWSDPEFRAGCVVEHDHLTPDFWSLTDRVRPGNRKLMVVAIHRVGPVPAGTVESDHDRRVSAGVSKSPCNEQVVVRVILIHVREDRRDDGGVEGSHALTVPG